MQSTGVHNDERVMKHKDGSLFWCRVTGETLDSEHAFKNCVWSFVLLQGARDTPTLTAREYEVALNLCKGLTSKEIALELQVSPRTIDIHRANLLRKYKVRNVAELLTKILKEL